MRRRGTAAAAFMVGVALLASPARAGETIEEDDPEYPEWEGSTLSDAGNVSALTVRDVGAVSLAGSFDRVPYRTIRVVLKATPVGGSGCPVADIPYLDDTAPNDEGLSRNYEFAGTFAVPCNGRYLVAAVASTTDDAPDPPGPFPSPNPHDEAILDRTVAVVVPPNNVEGVQASEGTGRAVTVTWTEVTPKPQDHLGYAVVRAASDGSVEVFNVPAANGTTFVDTNPPAAGGDTAYEVFARRPGADSTSEVRSTTPGRGVVAVSAAPAGPGNGGGGSGGTGDGGTGGPTAGGGGTGTTGRSPSVNAGPTIRVPRVGTPSRNFFPALLAPPVADTFDDELPYDEQELGDDEAALPGDLDIDASNDRLPGAGLAVPMATGLVLGVWALHLRFLARASRPTYDERIDVIIE